MGGEVAGFNTILYEKEESIALIRLNRPESLNALSDQLLFELNKIIDSVAAEEKISVVIITGTEKVFAAGADIKEVINLTTPLKAHRFVRSIQGVFNKIEMLEKPVIAAVSGLALGAGCELALACDFRIAASNAMFGQPEIKIGLIPGAGGTQRLPRLIGQGRAKELLYTGNSIDASEAYRIGLVNRVVPKKSLIGEVKRFAHQLKKQPQVALRLIKSAVNEGMKMDFQSALDYEGRCFEIVFSTEDQKEGLKAFINKAKPIFRGR
jgi:enoyl-CoA hydratase/carnithine racemase